MTIDAALIGARWLQYAGVSVLWGSPLFFLYAARVSGAAVSIRGPWQRPLVLGAALLTLSGALVWLMAETRDMGGESVATVDLTVLWTIMTETRFGFACCVRIVLLLASVGVCFALTRLETLWRVQAILGGAITTSLAWTGHGATQIGRTAGLHLAADLLHLFAAGIWGGALVPLVLVALRARRSGDFEDIRMLSSALQAFSRVGAGVVAVLVASGILNVYFLVDPAQWREDVTSVYGRVLGVKLTLFVAMVGVAALHRYRTTPALHAALRRGIAPTAGLEGATSSLLLETALAASVLGAVSVLGTLAPPGT